MIKIKALRLRGFSFIHKQELFTMIKKISRAAIFRENEWIASEISKLPNAFYEDHDVGWFENDQERIEYQSAFDAKNFPQKQVGKSEIVISFEHSDLTSYPPKLAQKLAELMHVIGMDRMFVIAHLKMNFFGNLDNKYKPLVNAYEKLKRITGTVQYDEGWTIDVSDLPSMIEIAFWIERCDPSAPEYVFFFDSAGRLSFHLCKYGNVHVEEFETKLITDFILNKTGWYTIEGTEYDKFSADGRIAGRQLKL